jgi:hypothetical protein
MKGFLVFATVNIALFVLYLALAVWQAIRRIFRYSKTTR